MCHVIAGMSDRHSRLEERDEFTNFSQNGTRSNVRRILINSMYVCLFTVEWNARRCVSIFYKCSIQEYKCYEKIDTFHRHYKTVMCQYIYLEYKIM